VERTRCTRAARGLLRHGRGRAEWVATRPDNIAIGVDLDRPTLEWGRASTSSVGRGAARIRLIEADVRTILRPKADLIAALNFSYFVFHTREDLRGYFRTARKALAPGGLLLLDAFGGWEAQALTTEKKRKRGFTYLWQQAAFDPISHRTRFHIHFRFPDGTMMKRAFTYDWRLWSLPEIQETLAEAGFTRSEIYWEGTDLKTGYGNGVFRKCLRTTSTPGWVAYIAAGCASEFGLSANLVANRSATSAAR